jgi:hypothetical protein
VHQHEKLFRKQLDNGETKQFPLIKSLAEMGKKVSHGNFMRDAKDHEGKLEPELLFGVRVTLINVFTLSVQCCKNIVSLLKPMAFSSLLYTLLVALDNLRP